MHILAQFGYNLATTWHSLVTLWHNLTTIWHNQKNIKLPYGCRLQLQEEAENERMHLLTFLQLKQPGPIFRASVIVTQWVFTGLFSTAYLISPNYCHRYVVGLLKYLWLRCQVKVQIGCDQLVLSILSLNFHQRLCVLGMIDFISSHGLIKSQQATLLTHII